MEFAIFMKTSEKGLMGKMNQDAGKSRQKKSGLRPEKIARKIFIIPSPWL
jgi:hypothetical protein